MLTLPTKIEDNQCFLRWFDLIKRHIMWLGRKFGQPGCA